MSRPTLRARYLWLVPGRSADGHRVARSVWMGRPFEGISDALRGATPGGRS